MRFLFQVLVTLLVFAGGASAALAQDKPRIVVVNHALEYFAQTLAGEEADVVFPVPDGTDPSFWRPSIAEIGAIQSADLILLNGADFAAWVARVSLPRARVVDTSRSIQSQFIATESITHSHGGGDAHAHQGTATYLWLDPNLAIEQARAVAEGVKAHGIADPEAVDARLAVLITELQALDAAARKALRDAGDIVFVATHPRYQYLARAYDLTILSLEWEAGAMPSQQDIDDLEMLTREEGARVLIWEAAPPASARARIAGLGLEDAVFPTLAAPTGSETFNEAFLRAVTALGDAASRATAR